MPSFAAGYSAAANRQNADTARRQLQLKAEEQERLVTQQDATTEAIDAETAAELATLGDDVDDMRLESIDNALISAAESGDFSSLNDLMAKPRIQEVFKMAPAITEAYGAGITKIRKFNPDSDEDVSARKEYSSVILDDDLPYDEMPDEEKQFVDENIVMADLGNGTTRAIRKDELLNLLGGTERKTKARNLSTSLNDRALQIARIKRAGEQQKLGVLNPSYTPPEGTDPKKISSEAANAYKRLRDSGADSQLIADVMGAFGFDVNQPHIKAQLGLEEDAALTAIDKDDAASQKALQDIEKMESEAEQLEAYNKIGESSGYGEASGALVKDLIDTGKYGIKDGKLVQFKTSSKTPARVQYLEEAEKAIKSFDKELQDKKTADGKEAATWDNYSKWPKELQDKAAIASDKYDTLTESSPPTDSMKRDLATLNQTLFASGRFVREGEEATTGPIDSAVNILKTYLEIDDQNRRIEKAQELAGMLVAASLDERTSKYLFEKVASVFGSSYGQSFKSALGGAELFLSTQKAKVDSIRNETTNPFTRARLDFYSSQIEKSLELARDKLGKGLTEETDTSRI